MTFITGKQNGDREFVDHFGIYKINEAECKITHESGNPIKHHEGFTGLGTYVHPSETVQDQRIKKLIMPAILHQLCFGIELSTRTSEEMQFTRNKLEVEFHSLPPWNSNKFKSRK
jgi:hypothetical protein